MEQVSQWRQNYKVNDAKCKIQESIVTAGEYRYHIAKRYLMNKPLDYFGLGRIYSEEEYKKMQEDTKK